MGRGGAGWGGGGTVNRETRTFVDTGTTGGERA